MKGVVKMIFWGIIFILIGVALFKSGLRKVLGPTQITTDKVIFMDKVRHTAKNKK